MTWDIAGILLLQSVRHPVLDFLALFLAYLFSSTFLVVFIAALMILFAWKKNSRHFLLAFSTGLMMLVVKILKDVFARTRPDYAISLPMLPHSVYSFPSGHTTAAFLLAVVLSKKYPKYAPALFAIAVLTGISRLYLGLHYVSDVLASIVMGLTIGFFCLWKEKQIISIGEEIIKFAGSFQKSWQH